MKAALLLFACLLGQHQVRSQTSPALVVTAEVVGVGPSGYNMNGCYLKLTVKNVSSANRTVAIFSCSWQDSWAISKQGLRLGAEVCESNYPVELKLVPGQQINFYGFLRVLKLSEPVKITKRSQVLDSYSGVRFGFRDSSVNSLFGAFKDKHSVTYWSNPVSLIAVNNFYEVQQPPAK